TPLLSRLPTRLSPPAPGLLHSSPTRRSSDLRRRPGPRAPDHPPHTTDISCSWTAAFHRSTSQVGRPLFVLFGKRPALRSGADRRSEEHTSELQSRENLVCRLLLEKKKTDSTA